MSWGRPVSRAERRQLERDNAKRPDEFRAVPETEWPEGIARSRNLLAVYRSRRFFVQIIRVNQPPCELRLTINRTEIDAATQRWRDGITWDELQAIKSALGFGTSEAVEIYPADVEVVNDANMRHLWVLGERLPFGWQASGGARSGSKQVVEVPCT